MLVLILSAILGRSDGEYVLTSVTHSARDTSY